MPRITEGISLAQLIEGGAEFEINPNDNPDSEEDETEVREAMLSFTNMSCLGSDENYDEEPFRVIGKDMIDLTPDGGVKKRILRPGYGTTPPNLSLVKIDYNAYIEYEAQPFDSTYSRKKKQEFVLNNGEVIPGLDEAVKSMKLTEKSQFLISPQYAYGPLGCLGRVPQNATVLFEIELQEVVNSGATISYEKLEESEKNSFKEVYAYCLSLCERAKDKFRKNVKESLKDYNTAVSKLELVQMKDYSEQEKQQELLLRVLGNVLVCNTVLGNPKKGCCAANRIYQMCKGTTLKISAKTYFSHAKCLRMLGEFVQARAKLEQARKLEPQNPEIANEFITLRREEEKFKKEEKIFSKRSFNQI
ncbi:inactive peptidyl-prolyl cis-trans isomerase shutdown [Coccinella septempunctata]|uniref:inactive peptidyl-prolyl cis-trans isomerase shutdown n=1 Tax=Coccinella septempunctata TaxID=41139 RepID=UPI001D089EEA|nr:inactive peptidyl-prolyl cis-trans isomerase shutdown [Coccinella septempunctata]